MVESVDVYTINEAVEPLRVVPESDYRELEKAGGYLVMAASHFQMCLMPAGCRICELAEKSITQYALLFPRPQ